MIDLLKKYWSLYGGLLLAAFLGWLVDFDKASMDTETSFLMLSLSCVGALAFFKTVIFKKNKSFIDMAVLSQSNINAAKVVLDPTVKGKELVSLVNDIIKKERGFGKFMKKVFTWIKYYWQQIIGLLGAIANVFILAYAWVFDKFGFLLQYFPQTFAWEIGVKIGVSVIVVVFIYFMLRNQIKDGFVGSIKQAEEYLDIKSSQITNGLSNQTKIAIKEAIKKFKNDLKEKQNEYNKIVNEVKNKKAEIKTAQDLINIGLNKDASVISSLNQELVVLNNSAINLERVIENINKTITKYEEALKV